MRRGLITATATALLLAGGYYVWSQTQMKTLAVVLYATDEVIQKGAVVSILIRKVPAADFEAAYPVDPDAAPVPGAEAAKHQWHATLTGPINLVSFEVPDTLSYSYQFRAVPMNGVAEARVVEKVLGVAGANLDADGNEIGLDEFGLTRSHQIEGELISSALVEDSHSGDEFEFGPGDCTETSGVRVCVPSDDEMRKRGEYLQKTSGPGAIHPWER